MSDRTAKPLTIDVAEASGTHVEAPPTLARLLCEQGAVARVVSHEALLASHADAIIFRGDAPGALALLRSFRDDAERPATPVVMLGTPEGTGPAMGGPGFGAELVLASDSSARRVLEGVSQVVARQAPVPGEERGPERTLELSRVGDWRPPTEARDGSSLREVSVVIAAEKSAVFASEADITGARRGEAGRGERRSSASSPGSIPPGPGSSPGSSPGTGSGTGTSQLLSFAPISDSLRHLLYEGDRRMFPHKPPMDVSLPRGEEQAAQLIPDEFLEVVPLAFDEPDRNEGDLTFVGVVAPRVEDPARPRALAESPRPSSPDSVRPPPAEEEERIPRTSPGTPTSMSRRPPEGFDTRSRADGPEPKPLLGAPALSASPGLAGLSAASLSPQHLSPPSVPQKSISNAGEIEPLGALGLVASLSRGLLDATVMLRIDRKPAGLKFVRGELVGTSGEGFRELRRAALHRLLEAQLGKGRAVEALQGEPTFVTQRAARLADDQALGELLVRAEGTYAVSTNDAARSGEGPSRLTQRAFLPTLFELARTHVKSEAVERFFGLGQHAASTPFLRLSRIALAQEPALDALLHAVEAQRELGWLLHAETATEPTTLGALLARAPSESGLVGAVFLLVQLGALSVRTTDVMPSSLAHTDLDAQAEQAIRTMRERADHADYFQILGLPRDCQGHAVDEALTRLTRELLAWPLADLGLSRLEPDRLRVLSALREAHEVLVDARDRRVYADALGASA